VPPVVAAPAVPAARRIVLEDRVELPRLYLMWPSAGLFRPGDAELDLVADVLGNGRTSRLYARLIHDQRIATELAAAQTSRELAGTFQVLATAAPGHTLAELREAIVGEVSRFRETGPSAAELERGRAQAEAAFVFRTQTLGGFGGKADQLNAYNTYTGSPDYFDRDLARFIGASADDLRDAAAHWLDPQRAVELSVVPVGRVDLALDGSVPVGGAAR
jgi:zinc protease